MPGLSPAGARIERRREALAIGRRRRRAGLQSRSEELLVMSYAQGRSARLAFQIYRSSDSHHQTWRAVSVLIIIFLKHVQIKAEHSQPHEMATTFGVL